MKDELHEYEAFVKMKENETTYDECDTSPAFDEFLQKLVESKQTKSVTEV
jgi:hypothetical protein